MGVQMVPVFLYIPVFFIITCFDTGHCGVYGYIRRDSWEHEIRIPLKETIMPCGKTRAKKTVFVNA
jgi:hypothetical protein